MEYKIKEYRIQSGKSITQLAEETGISRVYLSQIENGKATNVSSKLLVRLADSLNVKVSDIFIME